MDARIEQVAREISRDLLEQGAKATVVTGSHARGSATEHSDIDIFALGEGEPRFEQRDGDLLVVYWWTPEEVRRRFYQPDLAVMFVRAWTDAQIVEDPHGIAGELQREAREWSWDKIAREADAWVVDKLILWSEYVQKLAGALEEGRRSDIGALRSELALRMADALAVRKRLITESENGLWDAIADAGGPEWQRAQAQALALGGEDLETSAAAAIQLFCLLVADARPLFDEGQREIVDRVLAVAEPWR